MASQIDVMYDHGIPFTWLGFLGGHTDSNWGLTAFDKSLDEARDQLMAKDLDVRSQVRLCVCVCVCVCVCETTTMMNKARVMRCGVV